MDRNGIKYESSPNVSTISSSIVLAIVGCRYINRGVLGFRKVAAMTNITVIKHLLILGITSIILNLILAVALLAAYIAIIVLYSLLSNGINIFAAVIESIGLIAMITGTILTLVGSCLAIAPSKKTRLAGLISSIAAIWTLSTHCIINVIIMILSFILDVQFDAVSVVLWSYVSVNCCVSVSSVDIQFYFYLCCREEFEEGRNTKLLVYVVIDLFISLLYL